MLKSRIEKKRDSIIRRLNLPVFRLKPKDGSGPVKILYQNHIIPLGQGIEPMSDTEPTPNRRILQRRRI